MALGPVGAALGAAGISAAGGLLGTAVSNRASAKQARLNREFQERMSNTAFQRAADDLEAAGLNRILALGSPASTPGGAMGQVYNYGSPIESAVNSGIGAYTSAYGAQQSQATIANLEANTKLANTRQLQELQKTKIYEAIAPIIAQAGRDFSELVGFLRDPARISELRMILNQESDSIRSTLDTLLSEIYGSRYEGSGVQDFIRPGTAGQIKLGSGGPQ